MKLFPSVFVNPRFKLLQSLKLFQNLNRKELELVHEMFHERSYLAGEVIFDEGEEGQAFYVVESGRIEIRGKASAFRTKSLEAKTGDFFGELALLDTAPRSAQAVAVENSVLLCLFRADLDALIESRVGVRVAAKLSLELARHLAQILREAMDEKHKLFHI